MLVPRTARPESKRLARTIAAVLLCSRYPVRILLVTSGMISAPQVDELLVPDDVLAERARSGSPSAFAELVERHREAVYTIVRNLCRTATDTEETSTRRSSPPGMI